MDKSKWWLCSKIVWLNLFGFVAAVLYALEPLLPQLEPLLPRNAYGWVVVAVSLLTVVLRVYSVNPVRLRRVDRVKFVRRGATSKILGKNEVNND